MAHCTMTQSQHEKRDFEAWLRPWLSPSAIYWASVLCLALYTVDQALGLIQRLGITIVGLVVIGVSGLRLAYVLKATEESSVYPNEKRPKFDRDTKGKYGQAFGALFVIVMLTFAVQYWPSRTDSATNGTATIPIEDLPTTMDGYPHVEDIPDFPTKEMVEQQPKISPESVTFSYRNATGQDLRLLLYDCYCYHFPIDSPVRPSPWRPWAFPPIRQAKTFDDFQRGTGWYVFFVQRVETGEIYRLGTKNIFYSKWPTLTVVPSGDNDAPFKAIFESED